MLLSFSFNSFQECSYTAQPDISSGAFHPGMKTTGDTAQSDISSSAFPEAYLLGASRSFKVGHQNVPSQLSKATKSWYFVTAVRRLESVSWISWDSSVFACEIWEMFCVLRPVSGLIFLFMWEPWYRRELCLECLFCVCLWWFYLMLVPWIFQPPWPKVKQTLILYKLPVLWYSVIAAGSRQRQTPLACL